ncbi:MAG: hypothetical protein O7G85_13580 [Planctomycetota bacterium]|nr:hypothetical protein [Planctomycetota bacterium]
MVEGKSFPARDKDVHRRGNDVPGSGKSFLDACKTPGDRDGVFPLRKSAVLRRESFSTPRNTLVFRREAGSVRDEIIAVQGKIVPIAVGGSYQRQKT